MASIVASDLPSAQRARLARIVEAAAQLIGEQGLRATTMAAIAESAGVAKPTLYRYFPDKDAVVRAVADALMGGVEDKTLAALAAQEAPVQRVVAAMQAWAAEFHDRVLSLPHAQECLEWRDVPTQQRYAALRETIEAAIAAEIARLPAHRALAADRAALVMRACSGLKESGRAREPLLADIAWVVEGILR